VLRSEVALPAQLKSVATCLIFVLLSHSDALAAKISARRYRESVKELASARFQGRSTGTPELDDAARYLAAEFEKAGLLPVGQNSLLQPFPFSLSNTLGTVNQLAYTLRGTQQQLVFDQDFLPLSSSGSGKLSAGVVFAGYGITAPENKYDDYAGVDVRGKAVLLLRHEPQEYDGASVFEGRVYTEHSQLFSKALNARLHGAAAVLYVDDTANHAVENLEKFVSLTGPADAGFPFVQLKSDAVERWFQAQGKDFKSVQAAIDKSLQPQSFAFSDELQVTFDINVEHQTRQAFNVVGYIPGQTEKYIVVGAHYDHLGLGEQYSLAPNATGQLHPGADDNASGTSGVLALARAFGKGPKPRVGLVFIAFGGEELGLLGSTYYVNHPLLPLQNAVLMLNMDMIGRIRGGKVMVSGARDAGPLRQALEKLGKASNLHLDLDDQGVYGSSDHTSFQAKLVPTLFFFSGLHEDYHRPTDTWEKVNSKDAAKLLDVIVNLIRRVSLIVPGE
jgi:hypothetical protein